MNDSSSTPATTDPIPLDDITPRRWYLITAASPKQSMFGPITRSHPLSGIPLQVLAVSPPYIQFRVFDLNNIPSIGCLDLSTITLVRCTPSYRRVYQRLCQSPSKHKMKSLPSRDTGDLFTPQPEASTPVAEPVTDFIQAFLKLPPSKKKD